MQKVESQVWSEDAKALNLWPTTEVKRSQKFTSCHSIDYTNR